jgi:hypothetical protein
MPLGHINWATTASALLEAVSVDFDSRRAPHESHGARCRIHYRLFTAVPAFASSYLTPQKSSDYPFKKLQHAVTYKQWMKANWNFRLRRL